MKRDEIYLTPEKILNGVNFEDIANAATDKAIKTLLKYLEKYSWNTPYISFNELCDNKEATWYREIKIEESLWQDLKNLVQEGNSEDSNTDSK